MARHLTTDQIHALRHQLEERMQALRAEILEELSRSDNERYAEIAQQTHDLEDQSLADLLVDLNLADIDRHVNESREVEAALIRIAKGTYGYCLDCGDEIGVERLQAYPTAERCIDCQSQHEKRRDERHPSL